MTYRNVAADQLTFGVEIEGLLPDETIDRESIRVGGYHRGIQIPGLPDGWKAEDDCSIGERTGKTGLEVVSPILRGSDGLRQLIEVCQKLRLWGWTMNRNCGLHVHVGTGDLWSDSLNRSPEFLRKFAALVMRNETGLFASTGTKVREYNGYSSSARREFAGMIHDLTPDNVSRRCTRGRTLNLQPLASTKRTVEFRVFQAGIKVSKVATYVQMCLGLVCKAYSMKRRAKFNIDNAELQTTGGRVHQLKHDLCWLDYRGMSEKRHGRLMTDSMIEAHRSIGDVLGFAPTVAESIRELNRLGNKYDQDIRDETGHRERFATR